MILPGWVSVGEPRLRLGELYVKNVTICPTQACNIPRQEGAPSQSAFRNLHQSLRGAYTGVAQVVRIRNLRTTCCPQFDSIGTGESGFGIVRMYRVVLSSDFLTF